MTTHQFGATWSPDTGTRFRFWAPGQNKVDLLLDEETVVPLTASGDGWHEATVASAKPGSRYRFVLPSGTKVPDPASRFQPDDVFGPSVVVDPAAYRWNDAGWKGRPWPEAVVYELHVGAFSTEGTFQGAIAHLDHLATLGVTVIEIMPVAEFPGGRNWGYDGVLPYAPDSVYGAPDDFKALVDAAHARGIAVILDVVYNHFGPDGNWIGEYAPAFFTDRHKTPWGSAINYDGPNSRPVRDFFIGNARYWLEEFHLDGLRLDAVHAIKDDSEIDLLRELVERVRSTITDRPIHLILENEYNVASRLERPDAQVSRYSAQWNDDVHHVLHVAATGEDKGYYSDYLGDTDKLGRALAEGFAYQGEIMPYSGKPRGEPSADLPPTAFVTFLQNHDQVGNRAFGDRITAIASREAVRAAAAVYLLLPQIPMLFMGEEWAASSPFPFFSDFGGELGDKVREGRRAEFAKFPEFSDPAVRDTIPDPQAETTFASAKLNWNEIGEPDHAAMLEWYRGVIAARRTKLGSVLPAIDRGGTYKVVGDAAVTVSWQAGAARLRLDANLKDRAQDGFGAAAGTVVWQEGEAEGANLGPWSVRWSVEGVSA